MLQGAIRTDRTVLLSLLRSCVGFVEDKRSGEAIHSRIFKLGFSSDRFLQTGLLDFYSKCGCLAAAQQIFDEMSARDVVAHNAMIAAFGVCGCVDDARNLFDGMTVRSSASWNTMISVYCRRGDFEAARELFDRNPVKDVVSWNAIIDGYCKVGKMEMAYELFNRMGSARNSVTWNTVISGYLHCREFGRAISMFRMMQEENVKPTEITMVSLLSACAHLGALGMGRWIHAYIKNHNLKMDVVLGNALVDMYFKCGSADMAIDAFRRLPVKNVYCWNSVIVGLGMHGYGEQAIEAFHEMEKGNFFKPDGITFVGLLSGCSHSGLVDEGKKYFQEMHHVYGVEPKIEHYGCMVDLLCRSGLLKEALDLIEAMLIPPNCVVWGSLLRACRIYRDTELSEQVTKRLLELDPADGGNYVFLSNIYAASSSWIDVENCRRIMIERGVQKIPGCSSIELNNMVHEFVAGDTSHPQFEEINVFLVEIDRELRKLGYRPDVDSVLHDIEEEEKEEAIKYHSERIAIAFGLMNSTGKGPIRIVKNLRVCYDCHEASKLIAKLFQLK
ncbi:hypothetical protein J5N97_020163 [Dioscorea zingiberensis]|uniref:DYW domain-containing protein n=1 Tax=Dioscorea zingiberensis TaxID=325984 RepID=A0A9D5CFV9_9LILI|nr:hypothetical protein J5N97_020163 [Dioscorea zingiberensis]